MKSKKQIIKDKLKKTQDKIDKLYIVRQKLHEALDAILIHEPNPYLRMYKP